MQVIKKLAKGPDGAYLGRVTNLDRIWKPGSLVMRAILNAGSRDESLLLQADKVAAGR